MLLPVLLARDDDTTDLIGESRFAGFAQLLVQLVQPLDHALHQRRLNSPPDRRREDDDVGIENLFQNAGPLVTGSHVALGTRLYVIVDETHDLALHLVLAQVFDHHAGQRLGVRELASASLVLESREQKDRFEPRTRRIEEDAGRQTRSERGTPNKKLQNYK